MPQVTSSGQVQAFRYGSRRLAHAVETGSADYVPFGRPRRAMMSMISMVVAGLVVAAFAVYGLIKPAPEIGDAKVLVDSDQGGAFVVRDGVVHPALNIASALLAATDAKGGGADGTIRQVNTTTLGSMPHGPTLGIPGAPNQVPSRDRLLPDTWAACDEAVPDPAAPRDMVTTPHSVVIVGQPVPASGPDATMLVTTDGITYHLVWAGHRAVVPLGPGSRIAAVLGLDASKARRVSAALLNSLPAPPTPGDLAPPKIPGAGAPVHRGGIDLAVGQIVTRQPAGGPMEYLVVLDSGLQTVSPIFADLVRAGTGQDAMRALTPAQVDAVGMTASPLATDVYPQTRPQVLDQRAAPVLCSGWASVDGKPVTTLRTYASLPLPPGAKPVMIPAALRHPEDKASHVAERVYVEAGHGIVAGQSSSGAAGTGGANLHLVTDEGISYPVKGDAGAADESSLVALGLGGTMQPVPSFIVGLLPQGAELSPAAARRLAGAEAAPGPVSTP